MFFDILKVKIVCLGAGSMKTEKKKTENMNELFRKALSNLLKKKEYHIAPPSKKKEMLSQEVERLSKERVS